MRKLFNGLVVGATFLLSLTSCGGKSFDSFKSSLEDNGFTVTEASEEAIDLAERLLNMGLAALGEETIDIVNGLDAVKTDEEGVHMASIMEFASSDEAERVYSFSLENQSGSSTAEETPQLTMQVGSMIVGYTDDYTKGVLGI